MREKNVSNLVNGKILVECHPWRRQAGGGGKRPSLFPLPCLRWRLSALSSSLPKKKRGAMNADRGGGGGGSASPHPLFPPWERRGRRCAGVCRSRRRRWSWAENLRICGFSNKRRLYAFFTEMILAKIKSFPFYLLPSPSNFQGAPLWSLPPPEL